MPFSCPFLPFFCFLPLISIYYSFQSIIFVAVLQALSFFVEVFLFSFAAGEASRQKIFYQLSFKRYYSIYLSAYIPLTLCLLAVLQQILFHTNSTAIFFGHKLICITWPALNIFFFSSL